MGHSYTISTTDSTWFYGSVGNILDAGDWASKNFTFGLYVRPMDHRGQKFPLIGYWVD